MSLRRSASLLTAVLASCAVLCQLELHALKAAGIQAVEPSGGGAIAQVIQQLQANWEWLIITGIGLAMAVIFGLLIVGSQRAPEHLFRIAGGIVGILVVIPAVLK